MKKKIGILLTILISSVAIQTQAQTKPSQAHFRCSASVLRFGTGYDLNERFVVSIPESEKDKRFVVREVVFEDIVFKANAINSRVPHVSIEMPQISLRVLSALDPHKLMSALFQKVKIRKLEYPVRLAR